MTSTNMVATVSDEVSLQVSQALMRMEVEAEVAEELLAKRVVQARQNKRDTALRLKRRWQKFAAFFLAGVGFAWLVAPIAGAHLLFWVGLPCLLFWAAQTFIDATWGLSE